MTFNDLDINDWKELDIDVNSLWIIDERDKSGKHKNIYHGNFIPQIPNQLIRRFTKENELVIDVFLGSGTSLYECENLNRKFIGLDINQKMIDYVNSQMITSSFKNFAIHNCDVTNQVQTKRKIEESLYVLKEKNAKLMLFHPPYMDVVKFTDSPNDLSKISNLKMFVNAFIKVCNNTLPYLSKDRYFAVVIGDVYKNREVIPISFYLMDAIKRKFDVKLKGIIVKNIEGNKGKLGKNGIWTYRAMKSDYYIFKHEYIFVFKKEF
ncbi:DNA adenine methylase [Ornithobacterium rhinotracheale]|uniref:DNA methyltransferase n=1 Tax=Ornithobacterium rhinotracheale TaxID=28251 RepID=UPI00129CEC56|nr:DNA methyltransferase [Ornithobacterium rhinotracheale]MRI64578.1 DNA adenine methylase [Ornithobacterium rhinotracheale]